MPSSVYRIYCFRVSLVWSVILSQMLALLAASVMSEVAISVMDMFLLSMTAASDFASSENWAEFGWMTAAKVRVYLSV